MEPPSPSIRLCRVIITVIIVLAIPSMLAACGSDGTSSSQTTVAPATSTPTTAAPTTTSAAPTTTVAPTTTATAAPAGDPMPDEDAQAVRDVAADYWEAYNAYDADRAVSYLAEGYRGDKEIKVRDEIGRIKMFGVQLGVSEKTAPVLIGPDQAEMQLDMKEPTGTRTIVMRFTKAGGEWAITYSEEAQ